MKKSEKNEEKKNVTKKIQKVKRIGSKYANKTFEIYVGSTAHGYVALVHFVWIELVERELGFRFRLCVYVCVP